MPKDYKKEIQLIHSLIIDPAGFDVGLGGIVYITQDEPNIWTLSVWGGEEGVEPETKNYTDPMEVAKDFIELRHDVKIGIDYFEENDSVEPELIETKKPYTLN